MAGVGCGCGRSFALFNIENILFFHRAVRIEIKNAANYDKGWCLAEYGGK